MEDNVHCATLFSKYMITLHNTGGLMKMYEEIYTTTAADPNLTTVHTFWRNTTEPQFKIPVMPENLDPEMCNFSNKLSLNGENCLIAREKIEPGEILMMEKAVFISASPNKSVQGGTATSYRCHHCRRPIEHFVTCVGCDIIIFCGYKCRYFAWNEYHHWECYGLQRQLFQNMDPCYMAMRMVFFGLQFEDGATSRAYYCNHYNFKHFWNMPFDAQKNNSLMCNIMNVCLQYSLYLMAYTTFFDWLSTLPKFKDLNRFQQLVTIGGRMLRHYLQVEQNIINLPHCHDQVYFQGIDNTCMGIFSSLQFFYQNDHPNTTWFIRENYIIVKAAKVIPPKHMLLLRPASEEHHMCVCDRCLKKGKFNTFLCLNNCVGDVWPVKKLDYTYYLAFRTTKTLSQVDDLTELQCARCSAKYPFVRYKILLANAHENIEKYFRTMVGEHLLAANEIYKKILNHQHLLFAGLFSLLFQAIVDGKVDDNSCYYGTEYCRLMELHYGKGSKSYLLAHLYVLNHLTTSASLKNNHQVKNLCFDIAKSVGKRADFFCMYKESELLQLTCALLQT